MKVKMKEKECFYKSPIGYWIVCRDEEGICRIDTRPEYEKEAKELAKEVGVTDRGAAGNAATGSDAAGRIATGSDAAVKSAAGSDTAGKCVPPPTDPLLKKAVKQLDEYFAGRRKEFNLPLSMKGTAFQKKVWAALQEIPYGETRSYGDIAKAIGKPKAARAVGMANNRNPVSIIVPCHRVIGSNGSLVGYGGGLKAKEFLLKLEGTLK